MSLLPTPERKPWKWDGDAFGDGRVGTVQDTSVQVFQQVVTPTIRGRQQNVLTALGLWEADGRSAPTAYELTEFMKEKGMARDPNDVRPRCTEMLALGKVIRGEKRRCSITGCTASTWYLAEGK